MRRKDGRTRLERWANRPLGDEPLYSNSPRPSLTEKLISDGWLSTPSRSSRRSKPGYVRSLKTMKPVSTCSTPASVSTSTVRVCPPGRSSASNTVISCSG